MKLQPILFFTTTTGSSSVGYFTTTTGSSSVGYFYGAISHENKLYRIKTTIYEFRDRNRTNKPYTFEVIKIELLDIKSNSSILDSKAADSIESGRLSVAKLLQNSALCFVKQL